MPGARLAAEEGSTLQTELGLGREHRLTQTRLACRKREPRTMRVFLPILLSILLYIEPAHGLRCYNCTATKESSQCNPSQCAGSAPRCASLEAKDKNWADNRMTYYKGCASNCESFFTESFRKAVVEIPSELLEVGYTCCSKELCNGADGIRGSPLALMGALLLSLGPAFLWVLV